MRIVVFAAVGFLAGLGVGTVTKALQVRGAVLAEAASKQAAAQTDAEKAQPEPPPHRDPGRTGSDLLAEDTLRVGPGGPDDLLSHEAAQGGLGMEVGWSSPEGPNQARPASGDGRLGGAAGSGAPSFAEAASPLGAGADGSARLAKIFSAMEAKDAAAVLAKLEDEEVRAILAHMSDRKAAEVLGEFPPERAAALSRSLLAARSGGEP